MPVGSFLRDVEIGIGTWAWGDRQVWRYGKGYGEEDVERAFEASIRAGLRFFDTAEVYGRGRSEALLGRFLQEPGEEARIATKFMPFPWRLRRSDLLAALTSSLERLHLAQVDLYQIHWPLPPRSVAAWMAPLAEAVTRGLAREVGVSNYNLRQMSIAREELARHGVALASNQVEYSLLKRTVEFDGVLEACRQTNVRLIAYSPLAMGVLSGKYAPANPPPGPRRFRYRRGLLARLQPLLSLLREIGEAHGHKTIGQVAINWVICKGALPIPGAKNDAQAIENAGAAGWRLSSDEVAALDRASLRLRPTPRPG